MSVRIRLGPFRENVVICEHDQQRQSNQAPAIHARDVANRHGDHPGAGRSEKLCVQHGRKNYPMLGGNACNPIIFGMGADPAHHEHRSPSTRLPTDAMGWRSMARISSARLVLHPGQ
jgi:hypothetical protein